MSVAASARFSCDGCGKVYSWKPELAGKRAKCKCGRAVEVPVAAPRAAPEEPSLDNLYALADEANSQATAASAAAQGPTCPSCQSPMTARTALCSSSGYDLKAGARVQSPAPKRAAPVAAAAAAPGVRVFGYASKRPGVVDEVAARARITDLYVPLGLLGFGSTLAIWRIAASGDLGIPTATAMFAVWVLFESILVFAGCLIGIKWLGISLGEPLTAFLKIGAVVVGPFGLALAIAWICGTWVAGFLLAPVLYYTMLSVFFDMDLGEVLLLSGITFFLQYVGRMLVLVLILQALFGSVPPAVAQLSGMALIGPMATWDEDEVDPTIVQRNAAADDKVSARHDQG